MPLIVDPPPIEPLFLSPGDVWRPGDIWPPVLAGQNSLANVAVVTCHFNPCAYRAPVRNLQRFLQRMEQDALPVWMIELVVSGEAETTPGQRVRQVRSQSVLWHKERLLNRLIEELPPSIEKVFWVDADLLFDDATWLMRGAAALDEFPVVQPFREAIHLACDAGESDDDTTSNKARAMVSIAHARRSHPARSEDFGWAHPGFAWGARREILARHGLYDRHPLGSNDTLMVLAMTGSWGHPLVAHFPVGMRRDYLKWAEPFYDDVRGRIGDISGIVRHLWHGSLRKRAYAVREQILREHNFDPAAELIKNIHECWEWTTPDSPLARAVKTYFQERREDQR
ncbi:hypothetical protein [Planctopirus hydrillae]|uniref:Uncharacterized protein n=1 Tax=Planctopirus hydrillae TaxID=1841610 RepID=A0A1C3E3M4_9PLAN|nr:hypothetical protein [Planctopirus hydrillae]ODA27852.1 hypothetical protein A6X21_14940 [Planctopirus hydrillae]